MILLRLFWEFFKTGMFSVGGGLATLPFIYNISDKTGWFTHQQIADMIAVAESTPGPIGINMATYVGFTTAGVVGSLVATLGIITPDIIIILIIASFLKKFRESRLVESAFYGLRPASAALIAAAGWSVVKDLPHPSGRGGARLRFPVEGNRSRRRCVAAHERRQADQKVAPARVHRPFRRCRHSVPVLMTHGANCKEFVNKLQNSYK